MTPVRLLSEAHEELRAAARYYEAEQPGLGFAFLREVRRTFHFIAEHPSASGVERGDIRVRTLPRFPYRIYYRAKPNEILIIAVGHRRRRPGFWRSRA
jgi:plasmid stabilization system protein ParE